ncbi:MAG: DUF2851 family protein [Bacteroidota bacterium]
MNFPEEFLHFIWQFRLYGAQTLRTTTGEVVEVLQQGTLNKNAGPDFSKAKLIIGETTWVGNVEIHIKSSDWLLHNHQVDSAYENVILHVVYEDDAPIYRKDGTILPVLVLKGLFPLHLLDNYEALITSTNNFPCEKQINTVDEFLINGFLARVLVERLEQKSTEVYVKLETLKGDWDETFYHFMARNFGFKVNAIPMEMLAQSLPQQLFAKHKDNPLQIEALIFGQAGFLNQTFEAEYPNHLKREYLFLRKKYSLTPIDISLWKFMRMRPQNFPTLRLAQFAALIVNSNHLFSKILVIRDYRNSQILFENLPVHPFWETHYHFNKEADKVSLQLGKTSIQNILINTLSLFLFAYSKALDQENFVTRSFYLLENTMAENNAIIKQYQDAGVVVKNAFYSQGILQLKKKYCNEKKCLSCGIGIKLLKQ